MESVELASTGLECAFDVMTQCKPMTILTSTESEKSTTLTHAHAY